MSGVLALSRGVMEEWLTATYPAMRARLGTLTAARQGVPFASLFTQIWHEFFGLATRELAQRGLLFDPTSGPGHYGGSFPLLWRRALYDFDAG